MLNNKLSSFLLAILIFSSTLVIGQSDSTNSRDQRWQQNTFFKSGNMSHGGYGAVTMKLGQFNNETAVFMGAKGAWVINHRLGLGFAFNGVGSRPQTTAIGTYSTGYAGGYGGFLIEPVFYSGKVIHFTVPIVIGGGSVKEYIVKDDKYIDSKGSVSFGIIEPGIEVELNLMRWFRVSLGGYYAFKTSEKSTYNLDSQIVNPFTFGVSFKFGAF